MNKRILLSGVSIVASLALAVGATFAFFTDEGTSTGNIFGAGTFQVLLDGLADVTATVGASDMAPGDVVAGDIALTKGGTIDIAKVGLNVTSTGTEAFQNELLLEVFEGGTVVEGECTGTDITTEIESDVTGGADLTVNNFGAAFFDSLFDLPAFDNSGANNVCFQVTFDPTATDPALQSATANVTFTFKALQDSGQIP